MNGGRSRFEFSQRVFERSRAESYEFLESVTIRPNKKATRQAAQLQSSLILIFLLIFF